MADQSSEDVKADEWTPAAKKPSRNARQSKHSQRGNWVVMIGAACSSFLCHLHVIIVFGSHLIVVTALTVSAAKEDVKPSEIHDNTPGLTDSKISLNVHPPDMETEHVAEHSVSLHDLPGADETDDVSPAEDSTGSQSDQMNASPAEQIITPAKAKKRAKGRAGIWK